MTRLIAAVRRVLTARHVRTVHLALAVFWGPVMIPVTLVTPLKHSLPFVIAISLYANMGAHLASVAGESATVAAEDRTG